MNYLDEFPIDEALLPELLHRLLSPCSSASDEKVEVTLRTERDTHGPDREFAHMLMAVVPEHEIEKLSVLRETGDGVVSFSVPICDEKGGLAKLESSVSGYDYIVASWGSGSFYTYNLAEKVWMTLGLTPRCVGNDDQRVVFDDLSLPEIGVAEGEISNEYYWSPKRNVSWRMKNSHLRRYLWMRGAFGVRVFFYEKLLPNTPELRKVMNGEVHFNLKPKDGWYEVDIREFRGNLLLQVWATVAAVPPELCAEADANQIIWPDDDVPMTYDRANALTDFSPIFLDDKFLRKYEENSFYDAVPILAHDRWLCGPSYREQWAFTELERVGRNLIRASMRNIYKGVPDQEVLHAREFALSNAKVQHFDMNEEHMVSKTQRLIEVLLDLGDHLSELSSVLGYEMTPDEWVALSRKEIRANGWLKYPILCSMGRVAPLDMSERAFLSRCKTLHEILQKIPNGYLKKLLIKAGCSKKELNDLGSLKLLQAFLNVVSQLNENKDTFDAFERETEPEGWRTSNPAMAPMFINNDLRIADAHEAVGEALQALEKLGFETALVNEGYGRALDFVVDGVIQSLCILNDQVSSLLER